MTKRNSRAGLTLIEVLIAVSLLSLLTLGMMWAIRIGLNAMSKSNDKLMANRRVTGAQRVLEQEVYGLMPTSAELPTPAGAGGGQKVQFFQGEEQSMRFVSSYSLREGSRGHAQILAFQVLPGEAGVGVRLIVNETPYSGSRAAGAFITGRGFDPNINHVLTRFLPIEPASNSFVLADKLASCSFAYQEIRPKPEMQRWVPIWSLDQWPDAIRIDMTPLDEVGSRLHGVSVVAPVHVTRAALEVYDDN